MPSPMSTSLELVSHRSHFHDKKTPIMGKFSNKRTIDLNPNMEEKQQMLRCMLERGMIVAAMIRKVGGEADNEVLENKNKGEAQNRCALRESIQSCLCRRYPLLIEVLCGCCASVSCLAGSSLAMETST